MRANTNKALARKQNITSPFSRLIKIAFLTLDFVLFSHRNISIQDNVDAIFVLVTNYSFLQALRFSEKVMLMMFSYIL